jgi:succinoglycan biosynthesis protein ExoM
MLRKCLAAISVQALPDDIRAKVVIVDNESEPNNRAIVEEFGFHYVHEPRRGIAYARNKAIEKALVLEADRIAFIDDDQIVPSKWVANHMKAADLYRADVVQAHIVPLYPDPAPFWSTGVASPIEADVLPNEGCVKKSAGTGGTMFSSWLVRGDGLGLRFDERLALAGGEDVEFFKNAHRKGARIVLSALPTLMEEVNRSRLTYRRYVMRGLARGGQLFATYRQNHGYWLALRKYLGVTIIRVIRGSGQLFISPLFAPFDMRRFKFTALEGGRNIFLAAGVIAALFSFQYEYYRQIDGY